MKRRGVLGAVAAGLWGAGRPVAASGGLPRAASLQAELAAALRIGRPLVVLVSLEGCPYCKIVREHHLIERLQQGQPVVQVDMRSRARLVDLAGAGTTHDDLVRAWNVDTAPTVLFFGSGAREVAPRLEGMPLPDFYGAYLSQRIEAAQGALRPAQR